MGIRGLTGWIQWAAPDTIVKNPSWEQWKGKTIGIDILGFLYKAKAQRQSTILFLAKMIAAYRRLGITPIPIYDGRPPDEKRDALKLRAALRVDSDEKKKILEYDLETIPMSDVQKSVVLTELKVLNNNTSYLTSEERDQTKQFFYACGVLFLNASGEADNVLAYFAKRGLIDAVVSNDLDLLARGVETLLVPESYALPGDASGWIQYSLSGILKAVEFSYTQFVEMCVLMGCDYTSGQVSLKYKSAYWAVKYRPSLSSSLKKLEITNHQIYYKAVDMLIGKDETVDTLMGEKQWTRWATGTLPIEKETLDTFHGAYLTRLSDKDYELLCDKC